MRITGLVTFWAGCFMVGVALGGDPVTLLGLLCCGSVFIGAGLATYLLGYPRG